MNIENIIGKGTSIVPISCVHLVRMRPTGVTSSHLCLELSVLLVTDNWSLVVDLPDWSSKHAIYELVVDDFASHCGTESCV